MRELQYVAVGVLVLMGATFICGLVGATIDRLAGNKETHPTVLAGSGAVVICAIVIVLAAARSIGAWALS